MQHSNLPPVLDTFVVDGKRIESPWLSPRTWKALRDNYDDLPMFAEGRR